MPEWSYTTPLMESSTTGELGSKGAGSGTQVESEAQGRALFRVPVQVTGRPQIRRASCSRVGTSAPLAAAALAGHSEREGGAFLQGEVADIAQAGDGRGAVTLVGGARREADRVVLAAGVWSGKLAARLGHHAAMESERGYHLTLTGVSHKPPAPYMMADAKLGVTPLEEGLRFAGTAEFGGLDRPGTARKQERTRPSQIRDVKSRTPLSANYFPKNISPKQHHA